MDYIRVSIYSPSAYIDSVCAALSDAGADQLEIVDDIDEIRAHLQQQAQFWDYVDETELMSSNNGPCVRAYIADNASGKSTLSAIDSAIAALMERNEELSPSCLRIEKSVVREEDWANNWKQYYKPIPIGERLLIKPAWEEIDDPAGRVVLELEPGMAFGTGEHQSTRLCLEYIERAVRPDMNVLDLGCGSGILSIAALLLGAKKALAVDVEEIAQGISYENADRNGVSRDRYEVLIGDAIKSADIQKRVLSEKYDLIAANIVADVIIALLPLVIGAIAGSGTFICSGIIDERRDDVVNALEAHGMRVTGESALEGWVALRAELLVQNSK